MNELNKNKSFKLSESILRKIRKLFLSGSANQDKVACIIKEYQEKYNITLDPHTAVGVICGKDLVNDNEKLVTLSTAHPAKFKESVSEIISNDSFVTDRVRELESMEEKMIIVENNSNDVKSIIDEVVQ